MIEFLVNFDPLGETKKSWETKNYGYLLTHKLTNCSQSYRAFAVVYVKLSSAVTWFVSHDIRRD